MIFVKFCHSMPSITAGDRKRGREREGKEGREGREEEKEGGRKKGGTIIQTSIDYMQTHHLSFHSWHCSDT